MNRMGVLSRVSQLNPEKEIVTQLSPIGKKGYVAVESRVGKLHIHRKGIHCS